METADFDEKSAVLFFENCCFPKADIIFWCQQELVMINFNRVAAVAATAFAVVLSFSLLACSESNPTSFDAPVVNSDPTPGTSGALESSSSVAELSSAGTKCVGIYIPSSELCFQENCNAENEGRVIGTKGNSKHEYQMFYAQCRRGAWENFKDRSEFPECNAANEGKIGLIYRSRTSRLGRDYYGHFRCEQGVWTERDGSITWDTTGVQVGDARESVLVGGDYNIVYRYLYTYAGDGIWNRVEDNIGEVKKFFVGTGAERKIRYYRCGSNGYGATWGETDVDDYTCSLKNLSFQDTCVIESDGEKTFFVYDTIPAFRGGLCTWKRIDYDPVLGYCPLIALQKYGVKDGKLYSCGDGRWAERNMIPRQYIDSRKEGLTDDEFDVLDLPKDASVGDRMGGLLELCMYDDELLFGGMEIKLFYEKYNYCFPLNYYRYHEDGSWALETEEDLNNDARTRITVSPTSSHCNPEQEGKDIEDIRSNPIRIFHCEAGSLSITKYVFNWYERVEN